MLNQENHFRRLCSDTTFKYLFKCERIREVLEDIIFKIASIDLSEYELMDNEMNAQITDYILNKNHTYLYKLAGNIYEKGKKI